MIKTFKALSALLSYPTAELKAALPELLAVLKTEALLSDEQMAGLDVLMTRIADCDLYDLQEQYVLQFDRTRSISLHLFEHVHGEGRERGQAMVDLQQLYERGGLVIDAKELPDYLPLFLEFLSTLPLNEARHLLREPLHIIAALGERLKRRDSAYAAIPCALVAMAEDLPETKAVSALLALPDDDPNNLAALDSLWEETEVMFGPGSGSGDDCPQVSDMLKRMGAPDLPGGSDGRPQNG